MPHLGLPPALVALAAAVAGASLGVAGPSWPVAAGSLVCLVLGAARWLPRATFPVVVLALGWGHGAFARARDARECAARLLPGPLRLVVVLDEPTIGTVPALVAPALGCRGTVLARFGTRDTLAAGQRLRVEARWLPRVGRFGPADGLLAVKSYERLDHQPTAAHRLRNWLHRTSRALYGGRAGVVDALMLGRRGSIEPALNTAFARSGLVHILSISGFHVGLIGGWVFILLRAGRVERHRARALAAGVVTAYVGFIGAPPPALRAVLLAWILTLQGWRQRQPAPGPLFAATALAVLAFDAFAIADLGAWLSVSALYGATVCSRWSDVAVSRSGVSRIVFGSIGATLGTAPFAAFAIGVIAPIGVVVNLVAIPIAAVAVPGVLTSVLARAVSEPQSEALAAGSGMLLDLMERSAALGASVPGGALVFEAGPRAAVVASLLIVVGAWVIGRRNTAREAARRLGWVAAVGAAWPLAHGVLSRSHTGTRATLHFLSVGQGDASLVRTASGRWILIDAGPVSRDRDAGQRVVLPFLIRHGVERLAAVIVSHAHLDHFGGAPAVLSRIDADLVLEPGRATPDAAYRQFLEAVDRSGARWRPLRAGDRFVLDEVAFEALHPDTVWAGWGSDLNEDSIVLLVTVGRFEALFTGDAGFPVERHLAGRVRSAELLKVGHHGSATATSSAWLEAVAPAVGIVSTGPNRYGHPAPAAMNRLAAAGVDVWRTDREGTITVLVDEHSMRIRGRRGERAYRLR